MAEENIKPLNTDEKPKKNIFSMAFENKKRGKIEARKKNMRKGYVYMSVAIVFLIPFSILFLYPQLNTFLNFDQNIKGINKQITDYDVTLADMTKERNVHKAAYDEAFKQEQDIVDKVFPATPQKIDVIKLMEDFATYLDSTYPPFEFSAITFEEPKTQDGYTVLPFETSIHASQANFDKFLGLISLSGDYKEESQNHIRLMEISNITLRYRGPDKTGKDQGVDFDVQLLAYSR
jgi:cell division protein FtsL